MATTIFVPQIIRVGYQKRSDTYTGQLAYVIYLDAKGKVRKEASWDNWRDKTLEPHDFSNTPTSGFVLNKKVGGYKSDWNFRQAYTRVYDPRGFEFEITIPNLLFILENTNSIKGKGLEGNFVYGWDGTDLVLVPCESPDYKEIASFSDMIKAPEKFNAQNMIIGATYRTNKNEDWIYLGRFTKYCDNTYRSNFKLGESEGLQYFFAHSRSIETLKSLSNRIVKLVSTEPAADYAEIMDELEHNDIFSPHDVSKDEYVLYTEEEINERLSHVFYGFLVHVLFNGEYLQVNLRKYNNDFFYHQDTWGTRKGDPKAAYLDYLYSATFLHNITTLKALFEIAKPFRKIEYLMNGKIKEC